MLPRSPTQTHRGANLLIRSKQGLNVLLKGPSNMIFELLVNHFTSCATQTWWHIKFMLIYDIKVLQFNQERSEHAFILTDDMWGSILYQKAFDSKGTFEAADVCPEWQRVNPLESRQWWWWRLMIPLVRWAEGAPEADETGGGGEMDGVQVSSVRELEAEREHI